MSRKSEAQTAARDRTNFLQQARRAKLRAGAVEASPNGQARRVQSTPLHDAPPAQLPAGNFSRLEKLLDRLDLEMSHNTLCFISPDVARRVLESHGNIRRLSKANTDLFVRQIRNGEWQPEHPTPISFFKDGELANGQHRLTAIVETGITVLARVQFGIPRSVARYIDTDMPRRLHDRVIFMDDHDVNRMLCEMLNSWSRLKDHTRYGRMSPAEMQEAYSARSKAWNFAARACLPKKRFFSSAVVGIALAEMWDLDRVKAAEFAMGLRDPDTNLQPAKRLQLWLMNDKARLLGTGAGNKVRYEVIVHHMRSYLHGYAVQSARRADGWGPCSSWSDTRPSRRGKGKKKQESLDLAFELS